MYQFQPKLRDKGKSYKVTEIFVAGFYRLMILVHMIIVDFLEKFCYLFALRKIMYNCPLHEPRFFAPRIFAASFEFAVIYKNS